MLALLASVFNSLEEMKDGWEMGGGGGLRGLLGRYVTSPEVRESCRP